jgi:hypothetical protein
MIKILKLERGRQMKPMPDVRLPFTKHLGVNGNHQTFEPGLLRPLDQRFCKPVILEAIKLELGGSG